MRLDYSRYSHSARASIGDVPTKDTKILPDLVEGTSSLRTRKELIRSMMPSVLIPRICTALARAGIIPMLLKGALWQRTLYASAIERPISDVDILIPQGRFNLARRALIEAGFVSMPNPQGAHEIELRTPDLLIPVDLHRSLFGAGRYTLDTRQVFKRSRLDTTLYGVALHLPAPEDQLSHLIGHFAADHGPLDPKHAMDLARLVTRERLHAETCARHLDRCGLGRAARYALPELATDASADFVSHCLASLTRDPLGDLIAQQTQKVVRERGRNFWGSVALGHALNHSLHAAANAAALAAWHRLMFARRRPSTTRQN